MVIGIDHDALLAGIAGGGTHNSTSAVGCILLPHRQDIWMFWYVPLLTTMAGNTWVVKFYSTTSTTRQSPLNLEQIYSNHCNKSALDSVEYIVSCSLRLPFEFEDMSHVPPLIECFVITCPPPKAWFFLTLTTCTTRPLLCNTILKTDQININKQSDWWQRCNISFKNCLPMYPFLWLLKRIRARKLIYNEMTQSENL